MTRDRQQARRERRGAFTLLELMVVVGIIGLVAAMSVPSILSTRRQAPMVKAISDLREMCERARAGAVLRNTQTQMIFEPRAGKVELAGGDDNAALTTRPGMKAVKSSQFDPSVNIEQLWINAQDYTAVPAVAVNFYDNGTSDEMVLVLTCAGQREKISLEFSTALMTVTPMK